MKAIIVSILCLSAVLSNAQDVKIENRYKYIELTYISLNVTDYVLTINALNKGAVEMNPIAKNMTPVQMAGLKVASTGSVILLGRLLYKENPKAAKIMMICASAITGLVVTNNITVTIKI